MSGLFDSAAAATPKRLTETLRAGGALPTGEVTGVRAHPGHRSELSECAHLEIAYSNAAPGTAPHRLFLKIAGLETPQDRREVAFYREVAPRLDTEAVLPCYAAHYDGGRRAYHLLLPDISATHILRPAWDQSDWFRSAYDPETAGQLADGLAAVHARYWGRTADEMESGPLQGVDLTFVPEDIAGTYGRFAAEVEPCLEALGTWLSAGQRQAFRRLAARGPEKLAARFAAGPLTLVHGDPHTQNLVVPRPGAGAGPVIIDWGTWQQSYGPEDLASYMAPFWYPRLRLQAEEGVLRRYHQGLEKGGVRGYSWAACRDDYRLGVCGRLLYRLRLPALGDHAALWIFENVLAAYEALGCAELLD